jgi:SAM-dependent methyltransferase
LNTITKECRLCLSDGPHQTLPVREMMFGTRESFEYFSCHECDTLQVVDILHNDELARHYPPEYYSYSLSAQPGVIRWLNMRHDRHKLNTGGGLVGAVVAALSSGVRVAVGDAVTVIGQLALGSDARILDVGCGDGALLDRLSQAGFGNVLGVDPFLPADGETPLGVRLLKRPLDQVDGEFDLIMFNHSLEHVPDPVSTLNDAYQKLAAGGACLVRVPTTSSEAWSTYQADWFQTDAPRHMVIPSRQGMARAADAAGLRVDKTFDDSNLGQFVMSEAYRRDIAMSELNSVPKLMKLFSIKQLWNWNKRTGVLNRQGRGDQTGFVLRRK